MKIDKEFTHTVMKTALRSGAEEAEVFAVGSRNLTIEVKNEEIDSLEKSVDSGYSVRVIKKGRQGFSYSTDPVDFKKCVETALETSRWTQEDAFLGFPESEGYEEVSVFDPDINSLNEESAKEMALRVEQSAYKTDRRITKTRKTSVTLSVGEIIIMNSKDIGDSYRATSVSSHTMVVAEDGNDSQTGWDYQGSRFLRNLSFDTIGKTAARRALQLLNAQKIKPFKAQVILEHSVASEFLSIFASALSSEAVQKGKSLLAGKIGKSVASDNIDIVDKALVDGLAGSKPFDAEGAATRNKTVIRSGILQGYLYNTYTARKEGTVSTGNAVRGGFGSIPSVGITNMFITPSRDTDVQPFDSLISFVDNGLLVTDAMGVHTANPISGDFSVGVTGILIRGGRLSYPVKEAVMSGNVLDIFRNIVACGDDMKFYGKIGAPSLLIKDVDIGA